MRMEKRRNEKSGILFPPMETKIKTRLQKIVLDIK